MSATRLAIAAATLALVSPLGAQQPDASPCQLICTPSFSLLPAMIRSHVLGHPRVQSLSTDAVKSLPSTTNLELIFSITAPTLLPRTSLLASAQWLPTAKSSGNPFTEYTASELGEQVRANTPSVTLGVNVDLLPRAQIGGLVDLSVNVADLYSSAQRPADASAFTHKLDFDLVANIAIFSWLPKHDWLHQVSAVALLDYVATGLPRAGDDVPRGEGRFLTDARPATLIIALSVPIAPTTSK
ncbi:MAG: hypothetical protein M3068_11715 [Gemmatimonadota bacterium]|nr:hypothetical protein [Gemmatimonadota bacterium]